MTPEDNGMSSGSSTGPPKVNLKRPGFRKVKTGCRTCKIRRIKCDELKPQCRRCLSTGRVCDGYEVATTSGKPAPGTRSSAAVLLGPRLLLPRRDTDEIRSYRYFLDAASPALAGFFNYDFWLHEIPRMSHADPAIWHAVVSLGAAYELYSRAADSSLGTAALRRLVLAQFNQSIQCLVQPSARHNDRSRALSAGILFTHISTIQGQHAEALIHLSSSRKLLTELSHALTQKPRPEGRFSPTTDPGPTDGAVPALPVSISTVDGIIAYFEIQAAAIEKGGLLQSNDILAASEAFNTWRYYQAPMWLTEGDLVDTPQATWDAHLVRANRAAESLINGMIYHSQLNSHLVQRVKAGNNPEAEELLNSSERPFLATFRELTRLVRAYERARSLSSSSTHAPPLHLLGLSLTMIIVRLLFQNDPDFPDPELREQRRALHFTAILDLAESILRRRDDSLPDGSPRRPRPMVVGPVSMVAHGGTTQALRRRAIALMRDFPQRNALTDSVMEARIMDVLLDREQALLRRCRGEASSGTEDEEVPMLYRSFNASVSFVGERSAVVGTRT